MRFAFGRRRGRKWAKASGSWSALILKICTGAELVSTKWLAQDVSLRDAVTFRATSQPSTARKLVPSERKVCRPASPTPLEVRR